MPRCPLSQVELISAIKPYLDEIQAITLLIPISEGDNEEVEKWLKAWVEVDLQSIRKLLIEDRA